MLTSKIVRGMTAFRKVTDGRVQMVLIDHQHNVHVQVRKFCGAITHSNMHPMGERSTALAFVRGFFNIPAAI